MAEDRRQRQKREECIFRSPREIFRDLRDRICSAFPEDFSEHWSNSRKEKLLALRSLIDHAIEKIDRRKQESKDQKS